MKYRKPWSRKGGHYVDGGDTDILNAALGEGEGDVEGGPDEHVGRRHQDVSQAHVAPLSHKNRIIADEGIYENYYVVLLVLVVRHDGDDGVVYEQAKGEDPRETWKWRSGNTKKCQQVFKEVVTMIWVC